jgi:hypothetical protein
MIDSSTTRNEIQEKLKMLKKYEVSDEFGVIKAYCVAKGEQTEKDIREDLKLRLNKKEAHVAKYSELDFMVLDREFLLEIKAKSKNKEFIEEIDANITNIESHLVLQDEVKFDICVYSELGYKKRLYKLYLSFENTVKQMIAKYELQEKEVDMESSTNPYYEKPVLGQLEGIA